MLIDRHVWAYRGMMASLGSRDVLEGRRASIKTLDSSTAGIVEVKVIEGSGDLKGNHHEAVAGGSPLRQDRFSHHYWQNQATLAGFIFCPPALWSRERSTNAQTHEGSSAVSIRRRLESGLESCPYPFLLLSRSVVARLNASKPSCRAGGCCW